MHRVAAGGGEAFGFFALWRCFFLRDAAVAAIAGVGRDAEAGGILFVLRDDPRAACGGGFAQPMECALVRDLPRVAARRR